MKARQACRLSHCEHDDDNVSRDATIFNRTIRNVLESLFGSSVNVVFEKEGRVINESMQHKSWHLHCCCVAVTVRVREHHHKSKVSRGVCRCLEVIFYLQQSHVLEDGRFLHQNKDVGLQGHVQLEWLDIMCCSVLSFRLNIARLLLRVDYWWLEFIER